MQLRTDADSGYLYESRGTATAQRVCRASSAGKKRQVYGICQGACNRERKRQDLALYASLLAQQPTARDATVHDATRAAIIAMNEYQVGTVDYTTTATARATQ